MNRRGKQRFTGFVIALVSGGMLAYLWCTAHTEGYFFVKASLTFPAFLVLGIALMIFSGYRDERLARGEDISKLKGWKLITPRWWAIVATALLASMVNYFLLATR
jgi:ABC-type Fe3+-siderophore transport system permease subunit